MPSSVSALAPCTRAAPVSALRVLPDPSPPPWRPLPKGPSCPVSSTCQRLRRASLRLRLQPRGQLCGTTPLGQGVASARQHWHRHRPFVRCMSAKTALVLASPLCERMHTWLACLRRSPGTLAPPCRSLQSMQRFVERHQLSVRAPVRRADLADGSSKQAVRACVAVKLRSQSSLTASVAVCAVGPAPGPRCDCRRRPVQPQRRRRTLRLSCRCLSWLCAVSCLLAAAPWRLSPDALSTAGAPHQEAPSEAAREPLPVRSAAEASVLLSGPQLHRLHASPRAGWLCACRAFLVLSARRARCGRCLSVADGAV